MDKAKLTPRLLTAARMAGQSRFAVDVGTDHGRLAVWLLQNEMAARVAATDIRKGPLSSAVATAEEYGLAERIRFELCDGLDFPGAEAADAVIIAGMGGETIEGILRRAPWTLGGARLVLQPQSKLDELCVWLRITGYGLEGAALAAEGERLYVVLAARGGGPDLRRGRPVRLGRPTAAALAGREDSYRAARHRRHGERRKAARHL